MTVKYTFQKKEEEKVNHIPLKGKYELKENIMMHLIHELPLIQNSMCIKKMHIFRNFAKLMFNAVCFQLIVDISEKKYK